MITSTDSTGLNNHQGAEMTRRELLTKALFVAVGVAVRAARAVGAC